MDGDGFLNETLAEVKIKPWHILALLGVGGLVAYLLFKKKDDSAAPAASPAPSPQMKPEEATAGLGGTRRGGGYVALGEQDEPLYDGHPIVEAAQKYSRQGWSVFKMPTGYENVMKNRQRFPVNKIFAAPPGRPIPEGAERIKMS